MDTGPKHRLHLVLVGNGTEMVHRTGFMLKRTFRHERCQEHLSNRIVALSKRDERNRRGAASRTHKRGRKETQRSLTVRCLVRVGAPG